MPHHRLLPVLALGLLPAASRAQTPARFYVGAGAAILTDAPFQSGPTAVVGPQATVGLQLGARWALETGGQLAWQSNAYSASYLNSDGTRDAYQSEHHSTLLLVPLLARYALTRSAAARLQVAALGGVNGLFSRSHNLYTTTYTTNAGTQQQYGSDNYSSHSGVGLSLGPQLRYRVGSALSLVASVPVLLELGGGRLSDRLLLNGQLGAQLALGR